MSNPTFVEEIRRLRQVAKVNDDLHKRLLDIANNPRYGKEDRDGMRMLSKVFSDNADILKGISSNLANLALVYSSEPHDAILKALSE